MAHNHHDPLSKYIKAMCEATAAHHVAEVAKMFKQALDRDGAQGLIDCLDSCLKSDPVVQHQDAEPSRRMRIDFNNALDHLLVEECGEYRVINAPPGKHMLPSVTGSPTLDDFLRGYEFLLSVEEVEKRAEDHKREMAEKEKRKASRAAGAAAKRAEKAQRASARAANKY